MNTLQGKVALITGEGSGIGLATAREFHAQGARVVIAGRDRHKLEAVATELGPDVAAVPTDVTKLSDLDALMARTRETFGNLDILFVNAGITGNRTLAETDEAFFDKLMDTNFKGAYSNTLIVTELSRLGSSTADVISLVNELVARNIRVIILKQNLDISQHEPLK